MSTDIMDKAVEIVQKADLPDRHTFFQLEKFVIGKEPTAQAQLWAIVRELRARVETVEAMRKDLEDTEDNLELLDVKIEKLNRGIRVMAELPDSDLNIQEAEINIRKLQREKVSVAKAAAKVATKMKNIQEEMAFLVGGFEKIVSQVGEMKPLDDEQSQKEMWNEKFLEEFNLKVILQKPFDPEFVRTVLCLSDEMLVKKQMVAMIGQIQNKMLASRSPAQRPQAEPKAKITGK